MTLAAQSPPAVESGAMRGSRAILPIVLVGWFLAVLAAAAAGTFEASPAQPPLAILVALAGPPLTFAFLYRLSRRAGEFVLSVDLRLLTALQAWRVVGVMFLALYAFGLLPGLFAWPAGLGDAAVGIAAPFVLLSMMHGAPTWRHRAAWLNVAGLLDFAVAVGTGVLTSSSSLGFLADGSARASLGSLPLVLVPAFAVPLFIIFHMMSLLQLCSAANETR
jgi:hypothetical protein